MRANRGFSLTALLVLASVTLMNSSGRSALANEPPVAEAGLLRYAGIEPVRLDGTGSYDPDGPGLLSYAWRQLSGPLVVITDANSPTPLISGPTHIDRQGRISHPFVQTEAIQECEFELVVSDGEMTSLPDTVKIIIVPFYGADTLKLQNLSFDPNKPTFIFFGGGDCVVGYSGQLWLGWGGGMAWLDRANVIGFSDGYTADTGGDARTYYKYGDMIIAYLSAAAPNYRQPIQTAGWSTGGQPAIDVGLRLNLTYKDARYAVNRITFLEASLACRNYSENIRSLLASPVGGEQCWIDNYVGESAAYYADVLNVSLSLSHPDVPAWYSNSLAGGDMNRFDNGVGAGAYWSVIGPGKSLQLASTPDAQTYKFRWIGSAITGHMEFYDESNNPGRLPEPVTLGAWANKSEVSGDIDGAVLSCHDSENAVGYQLLFGSDPYRVMDYHVVSDTLLPPMDVIRDFPSGETWWTVRVRDRYGSTIYADPIRLDLTGLPPLSVENARTGKRYGLISHAILDAQPGDDIVLEPGTYDETIDFGGKTLTVGSLDPNDPAVVARTIVRGRNGSPAVTFSGPESGGCVLAGLTIQSGTVGVSCRDAVPTIRNCVVESPDGIAIEFWWARKPILIACTLLGQVKEGGDPGLIAYWKFDETAGAVASDSAGEHDADVVGNPLWQSEGGKIGGTLLLDGSDDYVATGLACDPSAGPLSVFAWVKGGAPGQVILSQTDGADWLMAADPDGTLMTDLKLINRKPKALRSAVVITDGTWHRVGLSWDGSNRILYVDDIEVAKDTQANLPSSTGGLYIGAGSKLSASSFWSGLIDDVRIYDRAMKP